VNGDRSTDQSVDIMDSNITMLFGLPGQAMAIHDGAGTSEILEVTKILERANIPCCIVGVHALKYFGAGRVAMVCHSSRNYYSFIHLTFLITDMNWPQPPIIGLPVSTYAAAIASAFFMFPISQTILAGIHSSRRFL
jgi:hypothetical protein